MNQVFDTHRLPYKNARIRAWSDLNKTEAQPFYNMTDPSVAPDDSIGYEVKTNSLGYLYTMDNTEISCLSINGPVIIEVSLDNGSSWPIQWIVGSSSDDVIHADDISGLTFKDAEGNNVVYNPLTGDKSLPNYALKSELKSGQWAEGTMTVTDSTPAILNIDSWTHTIVSRAANTNKYYISQNLGRVGQVIGITNGTPNSTFKIETVYIDADNNNHTQNVELGFGEIATAVNCGGIGKGWMLQKLSETLDTSLFERRHVLTDGETLSSIDAVIYNDSDDNVRSNDGTVDLGTRTACVGKSGSMVALKTNSGRLVTQAPADVNISLIPVIGEVARLLHLTTPSQFNPKYGYYLKLQRTGISWPVDPSVTPATPTPWGEATIFDTLEIDGNLLNQSGMPVYICIELGYDLPSYQISAGCSVNICGIETFRKEDRDVANGTILCEGYLERREIRNGNTVTDYFWIWTPVTTKHNVVT